MVRKILSGKSHVMVSVSSPLSTECHLHKLLITSNALLDFVYCTWPRVTDAAERMRISQTVVVIDSTINLVRLRATRSAARGLSAAAELVVNHRMRPVLCPVHTARRDATVLSCRVVSGRAVWIGHKWSGSRVHCILKCTAVDQAVGQKL